MNPIGIWFKTDRALPAKKSENPNPGESSAPLSQAINTNMVHYMGVLLIEGPIARGNLSSFHLKSVQFTTVSFPQPPHREIRYGIVMIGEKYSSLKFLVHFPSLLNRLPDARSNARNAGRGDSGLAVY